MRRRIALGAALLGGAAILALALLCPRHKSPRAARQAPAPSTRIQAPPSPPPTPPPAAHEPREGIRLAAKSGNRESLVAAARRLRASILADPSLLAEAIRLLFDPAEDLAARQAAAVVLGSLPDAAGKEALLKLLRGGAAAGFERTVILALGIVEVEDGDEFERDGQPYSLEAAPGLAVFVRGPVPAEARGELARRLSEGASPALRLAAARVLRDSSASPEVRQAFLDRVEREPDPEVAAESAAALCDWTRQAGPTDPERALVLSKILDAAPRSDEVVRFRLTAPLASTGLSADEAQRLHALASHEGAETRRFAVEVLGRRLGGYPSEDGPATPLLVKAAAADPSADVREAASLALGRAAADPRAVQALAAALRADSDWEVRAAAARSLGRASGSEAAREALRAAAASDAREEVRAAAERALILQGASIR